MKVLILGGSGMLGHKLVQAFSTMFEVKYTLHSSFASVKQFEFFRREDSFENIDAADFNAVRTAIETAEPDVIVNAIGIIKQAQGSHNIPRTLTINSIFPHQLAELSKVLGFRLITMSTDCVFSGDRANHVESHVPDALDLYGQSKH